MKETSITNVSPKLKPRTKVELERYLERLVADHNFATEQALAQITMLTRQRDEAVAASQQNFKQWVDLLFQVSGACRHRRKPHQNCIVCFVRQYIKTVLNVLGSA